MRTKKDDGNLLVLDKAFELAREITQRARKLPRDVRFVLGDRMLTTVYDVLDTLIEARYTRDRLALLQRVNLLLERLRYQVRLCVEEQLISVRQYEYVAQRAEEVGRMVGGWIKRERVQ